MTVRMAIIMCSIVPMSVRLVPVALVSRGRMGPMTVRLVPMGLVTVGLVTTALRHALNMIVAMIQRTVIATCQRTTWAYGLSNFALCSQDMFRCSCSTPL